MAAGRGSDPSPGPPSSQLAACPVPSAAAARILKSLGSGGAPWTGTSRCESITFPPPSATRTLSACTLTPASWVCHAEQIIAGALRLAQPTWNSVGPAGEGSSPTACLDGGSQVPPTSAGPGGPHDSPPWMAPEGVPLSRRHRRPVLGLPEGPECAPRHLAHLLQQQGQVSEPRPPPPRTRLAAKARWPPVEREGETRQARWEERPAGEPGVSQPGALGSSQAVP